MYVLQSCRESGHVWANGKFLWKFCAFAVVVLYNSVRNQLVIMGGDFYYDKLMHTHVDKYVRKSIFKAQFEVTLCRSLLIAVYFPPPSNTFVSQLI